MSDTQTSDTSTSDILLGRSRPEPSHAVHVDVRPGDAILRLSDADRAVLERCATHEGFTSLDEWLVWALLHHALIIGTRDNDTIMQTQAGAAMNDRWPLAG